MDDAPVFDRIDDPALAERVVHFVGRRRGQVELPDAVPKSASERLASILSSGVLRGFPVPHSDQRPVVCASDLSAAELQAAFADGLNARGHIEPWALILRRQSLWLAGMRPVLYVSQGASRHFAAASAEIYGPGWESLVMPTNPGQFFHEDWAHEREWRRCFDPDDPDDLPELAITKPVRAIVVGERGWEVPALELPAIGRVREVDRWWWNPVAARLVRDGSVEVSRI